MKKLVLLFVLSLSSGLFVQAQTTTVYIVRHGEKSAENPSDRDPSLSAEGRDRATDLAEILKDKEIAAIFSTDYKRTKETVLPLSVNKKIAVQLYDPENAGALAEKIKTDYAGKTVLIAGHSDTVLELTEAFGAERPLKELTDDDYDNLFLVTIKNGTVRAVVEKFGKPHHSGS